MCSSLILVCLLPLCVSFQCSTVRECKKEAIAEAIKDLKDEDADVRTRGFTRLRQNAPNDKASIAALIELLREPRLDTRVKAADVLGRIGPTALPALCQALRDRHRDVRQGGTWAFGYMGANARGEVASLIRVLEKDEEENVRLAAVDALNRIGGNEAISALIRVLKEDRNNSIRMEAAWALGQQKQAAEAVVPPLVEMFDVKQWDKYNTNIADQAASSLAVLGFPAVHPLLEAIKNPNFGGREYAIRALAKVLRLLQMDERITGKKLTADIGVAVPVLIESAKDMGKGIRLATMEALGEMGENGREALTAVRTSLKDSSPSVRIMAARAFYHIGGDLKLSLPVFIEAMRNPDANIRRQAIAEIEQLGQRGAPALPQLIDSLGDPETQSEAMDALRRMGPKARPAVPKLLELLKNKDNEQWLRTASISTLEEIGPEAKAAVPTLREIADKSKDAILQEAARSALEAIGDDN